MDPSQLTPRTYAQADALLQVPGSIYEIEEVVIAGRKTKVWKQAPRTMRDWMLSNLIRWGDDVFITEPLPEPAPASERQVKTYRNVLDDALKVAGWLRESGVGLGDRVAIGGRNSSKYVAAFIGTCFIGAVPVLLNTTLTGETQVHCITLTTPKLVLCDCAMAPALASIAPTLAAKGIDKLYCWDSTAHLAPEVRSTVAECNPTASADTIASIKAGTDLDALTPESDGLILFTSGTTSNPKAVLSTQRQVCQQVHTGSYTAARYIVRVGAPVEMAYAGHVPDTKSTLLHAVPLFHVTGSGTLTRSIIIGQKVVFMRKWDVDTAMDLIRAEKVTALTGVPALAAGILASPRLADELNLDAIMYGGAPAPENLGERVQNQWKQALVAHLYGATEANGLYTSLVGVDYFSNPTSVGLPTPILEMRVVHPKTRAILPPNEPGLITFKGGSMMKEYLNNPEATAAAFDADGWYNTGDVGYLDDQGFLYISDREKDMIIRGGENIASAEVENAVYKDSRILECAAVAVPDPIMTEQVALAVSLVDGASATPESIKAALDPLLRPQARPVIIHVWDGPLPRNGTGKIVKNEIREVMAAKWANVGGRTRAKL